MAPRRGKERAVEGPEQPPSIFDFPLDPTLFAGGSQPGPSSSSSRPHHLTKQQHQQLLNEFNSDGDDDDEEEEEEEEDDEDDEFQDSDEETDAEDELRLAEGDGQMAVGMKRKSAAKGKRRADRDDVDSGVTFEDSDELGRLIHAIRDSSNSLGGRTLLDKEFDRSIEEDLEYDSPFLSKRKRRSTGRRRDVEPSPQVKALMGTANRHYASGELDQATTLLTEIVRIDPSIRSPWYTLATIYEEKGDIEKSLTFKIVAVHLNPSVKESAREWAELGGQSRDIGLLQQAIYCFTQAIKGDKTDVDSMWDRAVLLKMSGSTKQAIAAFTALLQIHAHDPGVLREIAPLLISQDDHQTASQLYLSAFDYFRVAVPSITSSSIDLLSSFSYQDLESLSDFLNYLKKYEKTVEVIRRGVRWLQGREKESGWDHMSDDREFDLRRKDRAGWEKSGASGKVWEEAEVHELDVRLRVRLGVARMGLGEVAEAQRHFEIVLSESVAEFPELYGVIADTYLEQKMFTEALDIYQDMAENEDTNGPPVWIKVGQCHQELGDYDDAKECYEAVALEEPDNLQAKMQLAKIYEHLNDPRSALSMINEIIDARQRIRDAAEMEGTPAQPRKKTGRIYSKEERAALNADRVANEELRHHEFTLAYQKLEALESRVDAGEEEAKNEWLEVATHLVDTFRETRQLFPADSKKKFTGVLARSWSRKGASKDLESQAGEMANRLQRRMHQTEDEDVEVDSFRGMDFDGWASFIIKYVFLLIKNDEVEAAIETIVHVQAANVFKQNKNRVDSLRLAELACYVNTRRLHDVVAVCRTVWLQNPVQTNSLRLVQTVLTRGLDAAEAYGSSNFQKFFLRQIKNVEEIAKGEAPEVEEDEEEERETTAEVNGDKWKPTKTNPIFLIGYGNLLLLSRAYQSAIIYFLKAYDHMPENPVLNLSLAITYAHRSMSRQTDNRHHQIAQATAFFQKYSKARGSCQEVEYNMGRFFHFLGLQSYAIKHYEAVLTMAEAEQANRMVDEAEVPAMDYKDFSRAAAYNLVNLFVMARAPELARPVAERWLSL